MKKYALRYTWFAEADKEYTKDDIENDQQGLCDAMVAISVVLPEDGSYSQLIMSADGRTKTEMTQDELFKVWLMLGMTLKKNKGLSGWKKQIVEFIGEAVSDIFKRQD